MTPVSAVSKHRRCSAFILSVGKRKHA